MEPHRGALSAWAAWREASATVPFAVEQNCDSTNIKVTKRVDQANASCGTGEEDLTYTTPPRTYCFVTPK